jgi:hypothetical protein
MTYLQEYQDINRKRQQLKGQPKILCFHFGGANWEPSDTTSGRIFFITNTKIQRIDFRVHYNKNAQDTFRVWEIRLNYISMNFSKWFIILLFIRNIWIFKRSDRHVDTI